MRKLTNVEVWQVAGGLKSNGYHFGYVVWMAGLGVAIGFPLALWLNEPVILGLPVLLTTGFALLGLTANILDQLIFDDEVNPEKIEPIVVSV